jgi:erythrocyte band 7 integral membrane protein
MFYPQSTLDDATDAWGVMVERVEVKDVRVPEQLMRAMAAEAEAAREARAKVIAAEGEHKASRSLRMAAEVIMDSPMALQVRLIILHLAFPLQLRYLQTLNSIAAENNSTIIFPVPIDIISHLINVNPAHPQPLPAPAPTHQATVRQ